MKAILLNLLFFMSVLAPAQIMEEHQATASTVQLESGINVDFSIYPNPVKDKLFLRSDQRVDLNVTLHDVLGKEVLKQKVSGMNNVIDVSRMRRGVYLMTVSNASGSHTQKLIKS
ncbi:T9SS type A sorting domain-containing protein [Croceiramulus getboli]|nr:T9SS type A sorting domain-containing protein [Flavobacteriaceae bacterium YJPT1-3]